MRIVAGRFKGRKLIVPEGKTVRPTLERVREALFDRLIHGGFGPSGGTALAGAVVLDPFAGSGALALEALSRGARSAVCFEKDRAAMAALKRTVDGFGVRGEVELLQADATRPPPPADRPPATLVFLDPPYEEGLTSPALDGLRNAGWIADGAVVVQERDRRKPDPLPAWLEPLSEKRYGDTIVTICRLSD